MQSSKRKLTKYISQAVLAAFFTFNGVAYLGAYALTHFRSPGQLRLGLSRPNSTQLPSDVGLSYLTHRIPASQNKWLEAWFVPIERSPSKGTVLLFPGNGGSKATQLLAPAQVFHDLGYDTLLVDFQGVGGSSGSTTTLGAREAEDVAIATAYAENSFGTPLILYGVSMGSAAIMKAVAENNVQPDAIILELPFSTLKSAVRSRLVAARIPTFPTAALLVFWGSFQHGFNGFAHNPVTYANQISIPTLLLQSELDKWTTPAEIDDIFKNLKGDKHLTTFPEAGHDLLVTVNKSLWKEEVDQFLERL